jgi:hypothetical protein
LILNFAKKSKNSEPQHNHEMNINSENKFLNPNLILVSGLNFA